MKPADLIPETQFRLTRLADNGDIIPEHRVYMVRSHNPTDTRTMVDIARGVRMPEHPVTLCGHDRVDIELQNGMRICVPAAMEVVGP